MQHHYLYEHHHTQLKLADLGIDATALNRHLQQIWENRPRIPFWRAPDDDGSTAQRFLRFHGEAGTISARNYVGQIRFGDHMLHLLPKVFYPGEQLPGTAPEASHFRLCTHTFSGG